MINNNISNWINDIYDKYQKNQDGKKHVERVNIDETSFKSNLLQCIKKSTIEDKSILCMQIYNQLAEDALDIGSDGSISISPKVVADAEKIEIVRREEIERINAREKLKNEIESAGIVVAASILTMTKDEYEQLSNEQKRDLFAESMVDLFGTKENAQYVYDATVNARIKNVDSATQADIDLKIDNGEIDDIVMQNVIGADSIKVTNVNFIKMINDLNKMLQDMSTVEYAELFVTENEKNELEWHPEIINALFSVIHEKNELTVERAIRDLIDKKWIKEEQYDLAYELVTKKPELLENYYQMFVPLITIRDTSKELLENIGEEKVNEGAEIIYETLSTSVGGDILKKFAEMREIVRKLAVDGKITEVQKQETKNFMNTYGFKQSPFWIELQDHLLQLENIYEIGIQAYGKKNVDNDRLSMDAETRGVSGIDDFDIIDDFGNENNDVLDFFKNISMGRTVTTQSSDYTEYTYMQDNPATDYEYAEAPITTEEMEEALGNELLDFNFEELMVGEPAPVNEFSEEEVEMGDGDSKLNQGMVVEEVEVTPVSAQFVEVAEDLVDPVQEDVNEKDDSTDEKQSLWTRLKNVYENIKTSIVKLLKLDKNKTKQLSEGTGNVVNVNFDNNKNNNELVQQFNLDFSRVGEITEKNEESRANGTPIKDDDGPSMG